MLTAKKIIKAIGHPHLNLYRGEGYQYFVYDNGKSDNEMIYGDQSVYVYRLNMCSLDWWVKEGKDFIKQIEEEYCLTLTSC
jgi:hypothetical protein